MLAVFICHQVRLTYVCNDTIAYVRFCNFPPPGSVGGVASTLSPKKEKTPGFQRNCIFDGQQDACWLENTVQGGGSLKGNSVDTDTCKHTS